MSLNPDELLLAWTRILYDVFGTKGSFRQEPITEHEWGLLNERWSTMLLMNRTKLRALEAARGEAKQNGR